jgi:hypothetical protein
MLICFPDYQPLSVKLSEPFFVNRDVFPHRGLILIRNLSRSENSGCKDIQSAHWARTVQSENAQGRTKFLDYLFFKAVFRSMVSLALRVSSANVKLSTVSGRPR